VASEEIGSQAEPVLEVVNGSPMFQLASGKVAKLELDRPVKKPTIAK